MQTLTLEVSIKQLEAAISCLKPKEKIRLVEDLERQTWPDRFKALLRRIERKAKNYPITEREIDQVCEEVRHKGHAQRGR